MEAVEKNKMIAPIKKVFTRKRIIWGSVVLGVLAIILILVLRGKPTSSTVEPVVRDSIKSTVLATGQVTSNTDLNLGFNASDVVRSIRVTVGQRVSQGQVIATLDQQDELANATQARGALLAAEARLAKVQEGASSEEIQIARVALENARRDLEIAKAQQSTLVRNARRALLNNDLTPRISGSLSSVAPTITGTYDSEIEGEYEISVYSTSSGVYFNTTGLESVNGTAISTARAPLGTRGLFIQFPEGVNVQGDKWIVSLPNKQGANYVSLLNAYNAALETERNILSSAQALIDQRQAEFNFKTAAVRNPDLDVARADVVSAEGRLQSANVALENTILRAPAKGTITRIGMKLGELVQAYSPVVGLQDTENLYLEANINEANIASLEVGQEVEVTFDALGPNFVTEGQIATIEPSSTIVSGVVNYKIQTALPKLESIRPGMTANMTILVAERSDVLVVPSRSVIEEDGRTFVRVITDAKKGTFEEVEVVVGIEGDGGMTEIISGIEEGQTVVVLLNNSK